MTAIAVARAKLAKEADRRTQAQAALDRSPPSPRTRAGGWLGPFSAPSPAAEAVERLDMAQARERLSAERERFARAAEPRVRPPQGVTYRATPTRRECDILGATAGAVTRQKLWDLSPVDQSSFDPTTPPETLPPPPTNTGAPPSIVPLTDFTVRAQVVGQQGQWTPAGATYARQWKRDGAPIVGQTGAAYTLVDDDLGSMIGLTVVASNAGGAGTAEADEVGPVLPAP